MKVRFLDKRKGERLPKDEIGGDRIVTSVSQIESFEACNRQWWMKWVKRLPEVEKGFLVFGNVVHAVLERYLRADLTGRDEQGNTVDLYPHGWATGLSPVQQAQIRKMVQTAIDEGIITRLPNRRLEQQFWFPVLEHDGTKIEMVGFIDVFLPDEVHDHKTTSNMRYASSPKQLKQKPQMMIYAKVLIENLREQGAPLPTKVKLRHNIFCKDPEDPRVRKVEAEVTPAEIDSFWTGITNTLVKMPSIKRIEDWHNVPGPTDPYTCNKYGGCSFAPICGGSENFDMYSRRVLRLPHRQVGSGSRPGQTTLPLTTQGVRVLGNFKDKIAARSAAKAGGPPPVAAAAAPVAPPTSPPAAAAAPAVEGDVPPWARPECKACLGKGVNTKGNPCAICNNMQRREGKITSDDFIVESDGQGGIVWAEKPDATPAAPQAAPAPAKGTQQLPNASTPVQVEERTETAQEAEGAEDTEESEETEGAEQPEEPEKASSGFNQPRGRGRPRKGFSLLIGCTPTRTGSEVVDLDKLLLHFGNILAEQNKVSNYYAMDAFQRRDALSQVASKIALELGTSMVFCHTRSPDHSALVDALRPFATQIIEALA